MLIEENNPCIFDLPTGPTTTTDATFMRFHSIVSIHMISKSDCSHESLENCCNTLMIWKFSMLTLPQISHLNGRFSANSWRFLWAGSDCSRTFLPQMSHSTIFTSSSPVCGFIGFPLAPVWRLVCTSLPGWDWPEVWEDCKVKFYKQVDIPVDSVENADCDYYC